MVIYLGVSGGSSLITADDYALVDANYTSLVTASAPVIRTQTIKIGNVSYRVHIGLPIEGSN